MHDSVRHEFYWSHMANDAYSTVDTCEGCARNNPQYKRKRPLQSFPALEPLEFIAMNILYPLPRTISGCQYVDVFKNHYSDLARGIPTSRTALTHLANVFFEHWVTASGSPKFLLTDNEHQITGKFFAAV